MELDFSDRQILLKLHLLVWFSALFLKMKIKFF